MTSPLSFFINSHLAWLPPTHFSLLHANLSKLPAASGASCCSILTLSGGLNVWMTASQARPHERQWVGIASPFYLGHATVHSRTQTGGSWSVSEQGINLLWHSDSPLGGRPALGRRPTAMPMAARVMLCVRGAGMDWGTEYGGMEVNGQKVGEN